VIFVGILGLAVVIAVCAWVVLRDPEAISGRAVQERARSLTALAEAVRRPDEDRSANS
jgi:hypothetical protein